MSNCKCIDEFSVKIKFKSKRRLGRQNDIDYELNGRIASHNEISKQNDNWMSIFNFKLI